MKPRILKMQAFGPYPNMETIDFTKFEKDGLFLICGETGSGKTMILDAITYALYGKSSTSLRDVFEELRCNQCDDNTPTIVEYEFEIKGNIYKFERKIERKRKNLSTSQNVYYMDEDGVFVPFFENCKKNDVEKKAMELIGLDYNQFRQVVILPQGQFEKLLTSDSNEKEAILVKIFGVTKWQQIADKFFENAEKRKNELNEIKRKIDDKLAEYGCGNIEQLLDGINELEEDIKRQQQEYLEKNYDNQKKALLDKKLLAREYDNLESFEKQYKQLLSQESVQQQRVEKLGKIKKANELKDIMNQGKQTESACKARARKLEESENLLRKANENVENISNKLQSHKSQEEAIKKISEKLEEYKTKRSSYERFEGLRKDLSELEEIYSKSNKSVISIKSNLDKYKEEFVQVSNKYRIVQQEYGQLFDRYVQGIAGSLAMTLKENEPCPVCGSTSHPRKAKLEEGAVLKEEVDAKKEQMEAIYTDIGVREKVLKDLETQYNNVYLQAKEYEAKIENLKALLEKEKNNLCDEITTLTQLDAIVKEYVSKIESYGLILEKYSKELSDASESRVSIEATLTLAKQEYEEAVSEYKKILNTIEQEVKEKGFVDIQDSISNMAAQNIIDDLVASIEKYKNNVDTIEENITKKKKELEGTDKPDLAECDEKLRVIERLQKEFNENNALNNHKLLQMKKTYEDILKIENKYNKNWNQVENDYIFAKKLRGDTGISLQRYVLAVMFSCVISVANTMLENVHGGRYRLYRSDDSSKGTNKKGLELGVFDGYSNERRSVKTLSGGEKFLVSLALSIGLSTVAGRGGIHLDAMFIDEGFGSLDENSIDDAMDILMGIKKANGIVGIISHVQVLRDNIPAKIETRKSREGSTLVQS